MILKKKNPQGSENGFFQVTEIDGWCCGDKAKAIVCKYAAQLDTTITVSGIKVDSVDYFFPTPLDVNSPQGKEEFQKAFRRIVNDLGYIPEDLVFTEVANGKLNVYTDFAQLHFVEFIQFNYATHLTKRVAAVKTDCKIVGLRKADLCDVEWITRLELATDSNYSNVFIRPINVIPGATYKVVSPNLGASNAPVTIYNGNLTDGVTQAVFIDGNRDIIVENGIIKFHILNYSSNGSFSLTVTLPDGSKCCAVKDVNYNWNLTDIGTHPSISNTNSIHDKFGNEVEIYNLPKIELV